MHILFVGVSLSDILDKNITSSHKRVRSRMLFWELPVLRLRKLGVILFKKKI